MLQSNLETIYALLLI